MRYSENLVDGDIDYIRIKELINTNADVDHFINELESEIKDLSVDSDSQKINRNFLACLKLCKKFEKVRLALIPRSKVSRLYNTHIFAPFERTLRDQFERRYPSFAKTCDMKIIAHRAFVPYIDAAQKQFFLRYHPDFVEVDVCLCKSGEVLLQHDRFAPSGASLEESDIQDITNAVTLETLIEKLSEQPERQPIMIDIKGSSRNPSIIDKIMSIISSHNMTYDEVMLASFNMHHLMYLRDRFHKYPRAFITANAALDDFIPFMRIIESDLIIIDENSATLELINNYTDAGIQTWVYTVNHSGRFSSIAKMGAAGIITDYPNLLL